MAVSLLYASSKKGEGDGMHYFWKINQRVLPLEGAGHYPFLLTPRFIPIMVDFAYRFSLGAE
jgi:hypothetical protein